ncbi:MAG TPA: HAMP domain-containing sensor histidine kinase [Gemmatimonadaceae bacterium]
MSRRSRPATLWLQILLVGGLACAIIILVQTYRLQRSNWSVVERALGEYSTFAAWSYKEHLAGRLRESVDELLGAVNHGDGLHTSPRIPDARDMGHFIPMDERCNCHRPRHGPMPLHYVAFTLGSDTVSLGLNQAGAGVPGWLADPADSRAITVPAVRIAPDEVRWLNGLLSDVARDPSTEWGYHVIIERRQHALRFLAVRSMPTQWGDTVVYAFEYPPESLDSMFTSVLAASDLLPASIVGGRENTEVLDVEVTDPGGMTLFRSKGADRFDIEGTAVLPASYAGLKVRAQLKPQMAEAILIGGVPESRVPILVVILVLAIGLTVLAAVQLRREVRFAAERAGFVANVSHELRTPLSQIRLVLDTLKLGRDDDPATRAQALQVADREALRLQHLVEGVLRFTRGARPDRSPRVPVDAAREARTIIEEFTPLAAPHGMTVTLDAPDPVPARLQHGALRQVLLNLLDNAMKYGGEGTRVTVDVRPLPAGGARINVDDTGPGVPEKERARIFRPFERGDAAQKRAAGGSGIGLTIVREIAEEHGGRAWVESAPGGGARFVVEMPDEGAPSK